MEQVTNPQDNLGIAPSPKIRAMIVDDEPLARDGVRMLLEEDADVEIIGECGNGKLAAKEIRRLSPDLVFLDVQMPEMNGFEVLASLDRAKLPAVIFVTAYDKYALNAFEVHALDYLLKPYDDQRFKEALARAKSQLRLSKVSLLSAKIVNLLEQPEKKHLTRLAIKDIGRVVFLDTEEIDWIEAADYYVQLHVGPKCYLHRETMQALEAQLDPRRFLRVHRKAIVNVNRVKELRSYGRRDLAVVLANGTEIRVARSQRSKLENLR